MIFGLTDILFILSQFLVILAFDRANIRMLTECLVLIIVEVRPSHLLRILIVVLQILLGGLIHLIVVELLRVDRLLLSVISEGVLDVRES